MKKSFYLSALAAMSALMPSCSCRDAGYWTLSGELPLGADAGTLYVDAPAAGGTWRTVDSVAMEKGKAFRIQLPRVPHTTVFRLRAPGGMAYAPVDSNESITFSPVTLAVGGTEQASLFTSVDSLIRADMVPGITAEADSILKRRILSMLSGNYGSEAAYYVVKKNVNGHPLLSPLVSAQDYKLLRAVTNAFSGFRKDDSRTAPLVDEFTRIDATRRAAQGVEPATGVVYAPEISYFDIALSDNRGVTRRLSDAVDANRMVILSFVNFTNPDTSLLNMKLGDIYSAHHAGGLEIYQVGFDNNQHSWSAVAGNLPWINVYQADGASQAHLHQYMVSELPTIFIIAGGEVVERVQSVDELPAAVARHLK